MQLQPIAKAKGAIGILAVTAVQLCWTIHVTLASAKPLAQSWTVVWWPTIARGIRLHQLLATHHAPHAMAQDHPIA